MCWSCLKYYSGLCICDNSQSKLIHRPSLSASVNLVNVKNDLKWADKWGFKASKAESQGTSPRNTTFGLVEDRECV